LQQKVAQLEATMKQSHGMMGMGSMQAGQGAAGMSGGAMQSGQGMPGMGGMSGMERGGMGGGSMPGAQGMPGMGQMPMMGMGMMGQEGMNMMGQMPGMGSMQMPSALPGFPGASHIYHIGATGFFLDHPQHMALTQEQQSKLNQIKERALSGQATSDRWIAQGEQEIWTLTSSDSPDVSKIEAKVREVEKLRSDKRMAFIRAVGEAAMVLTDEQRRTLTGHANHQSAPSTPQ
jgi:Spy/CpxP family protein refolding chaperone